MTNWSPVKYSKMKTRKRRAVIYPLVIEILDGLRGCQPVCPGQMKKMNLNMEMQSNNWFKRKYSLRYNQEQCESLSGSQSNRYLLCRKSSNGGATRPF
ncbi:hypothetical protein KUTeg_005357 [Tegillarca granosa]|uniref:Uncharacterized protein n=1 Tax=Tegillarca granosa TaxID=220873 RepID=A0ABQ9FJH3_TEGGR|nr:hypothetical protein KUTeg_005357 [Tegillarca granosa]